MPLRMAGKSDHRSTQWGVFELTLQGPADGNPFNDVFLGARFAQNGRDLDVAGFYDGEGLYRVRFMPPGEGEWEFATRSNVAALDNVGGKLIVGPAGPGDKGPVRVANRHHFQNADGSRFLNIGTTAYAWTHQSEALQEQTLATLAGSPFTKLRMCVFPKHYRYNQNEPALYPFPLLSKGESKWPNSDPFEGWAFDFTRFEPAFFRHLEKRIADLGRIGVEADLILFHPYDRWGFSRMGAEADGRYLKYIVARLAAFPNVWWSMANEYDLMESKSPEDWRRFIDIVTEADPYGHLLSVHNCFTVYDHRDPRVTHASIQRPDPARAALWRREFAKPVSIDECGYEGDIAESWGNLSGRELVHRFWQGTVAGGYVTHGETCNNETETLWWSKGGTLRGQSVPRVAFLRRLLEAGPEEGLDPMPFTVPYKLMMAGGLETVTMPELQAPASGEEGWSAVSAQFATAGQPHRYYLTYFGRHQPAEVPAAVPPGERYEAILIDTWEMTEAPIGSGVTRGEVLRFAPKPGQALLLRRMVD